MKCPKCGYLGFETGDRCRNCGYDFSLTPPATDAELTLNQPNAVEHSIADLDLPASGKTSERAAAPLDLDRLFGVESNPRPAPSDLVLPPPLSAAFEPARTVKEAVNPDESAVAVAPLGAVSELPFDEEAPVRPPRPARPPLGVRRTTPDVPRTRPRSNRPIRFESSGDVAADTTPVVAEESESTPTPSVFASAIPSMEPAPLGVRLSAFAIDAVLLIAVSLGVLVLTLRIAGLSLTWTDVRILPPVPFIGFLALLSLGYVAAFTVAGGQTIGKMLTGARIIGDDGRPVDVAGGVLRALGCALVPLTLGLSYGPVILTVDRRALHDRLAGTRVVRA